jgi:hypothetical protein
MQQIEAGSAIVFRAFFTKTKLGEAGLTVTVDVNGPSGASIVTAAATTEVDAANLLGVYEYSLSGASTATAGRYTASFKTADATVDFQHVVDEAQVVPQLAVIDDIDTMLTAMDTVLTTVDTNVDTVITNLATVDTNVDDVETLLGTINANVNQFNAVNQTGLRYKPVGDMVEVTLGAGVLALQRPQMARGIIIQTITQDVRYTIDRTNPTANHGFILYAGENPTLIQIEGTEAQMRFLRAAAGAILSYQWVYLSD